MSKWNLIVDVANCTNCNVCVLACHDEHVGNAFPGYAEEMPKHGHKWIRIEANERGKSPMMDIAFLPVMCQHCDDAPCIAAAENGAVTKRGDGIVIIDPVKSKGQTQLVDACPYGAIWWNDELKIPQAWIFDAHLLDDGWEEPRAVTVCASGALRAVKAEDPSMQKTIEAEGLEEMHPEYKTKPRVWYKNLHRFNKCFIGGSVETEQDGKVDCVKGAHVT
ncbi:MAG: oxidoreductase, partial [Rhodospirillales bacterium]|nr:oxidoreductase [Rhodospirillales bacterium]